MTLPHLSVTHFPSWGCKIGLNFLLISMREKTGDDSSQNSCPVVYGAIPVCPESGTEGGDETEANFCSTHQPGGPSSFTTRPHEGTLRELSGRSRAILKQYFDETEPISFLVGHPTVAITESQVYHLLRVVADETLNLSCSAMKRIVLRAVKGTPATVSSRTKHFRTRPRAKLNLPRKSRILATLNWFTSERDPFLR